MPFLPMPKVVFVVPSTLNYPSAQVRVMQYFTALQQQNIAHQLISYYNPSQERHRQQRQQQRNLSASEKVGSQALRISYWLLGKSHLAITWLQMLTAAQSAEILFVQWIVPPIWLIRMIAKRKAKLIFDFDDAVFLLHPKATAFIVKQADVVIAGSHFNLDYAKQYNTNVILVPSSVPIEQYTHIDNLHFPREPITLGWIGSPSTLKYLHMLREPIANLARKGYAIRLLIAGANHHEYALQQIDGVSVYEVPTYSGAEIPALVQQIDIGLMPLEDSDWERGKCAMKCLIYMAGARATVSSAVGEVLYIVQDGTNGFLAHSSDEWESKLAHLIEDQSLRQRFATLGRQLVMKSYSTAQCWRKLHQAIFSQATYTSNV